MLEHEILASLKVGFSSLAIAGKEGQCPEINSNRDWTKKLLMDCVPSCFKFVKTSKRCCYINRIATSARKATGLVFQ